MRLIYINKKKQILVGVLLVGLLLSLNLGLKGKIAQENLPAYITLAVMAVSSVLFVTEVFSLVITSMAIPLVLTLTGVITANRAFAGFANDNVILFASMFIIGGAMFETGVADFLGTLVVGATKGSERKLLAGMTVVVSLLSAFLSNTGTVAVLMPVCLGIVDTAGWNRKNILMVLAMSASMGGMITLVGTPPNITVNAVLTSHGVPGFGFFEFAWVGIPLAALGGAWVVLTRKTSDSKGLKQAEQGKPEKPGKRAMKFGKKQFIATGVMAGVVVAMASGLISLHIAAALGAFICVLCGLLTEKEAIEAIDWTTIFLFSGTLVLAEALDKTGAGRMIADSVIRLIGTNTSEWVLLTVVFLLAVTLTQFMSNTAICALLAPIGLQIAVGLQANPRGVLMVVAIASSSAFATPMATPPNTLVLGPGKFSVKDYIKTGIPLIVLSYVVLILIIPRVWPLYG